MGIGDAFEGRTLGSFVIKDMIGEGSYGAVYRATQAVLDREAVVKVAKSDPAERPELVAQFLREAQLASRIDHPFAAHVYAFGAETDGTLWIAMELVRGVSLSALLEDGPMPVARAVQLLTRLCEVVQAVHEQGIVHRDIKPGNVMLVSRSGSVFPKLLDLGVAADLRHAAGAANGTGPNMGGTPLYMAPEQWVPGAPITAATDVYALGALAYETLVGHPPFQSETILELAAKHAREAPPQLPSGFNIGLSEVIAKALAKRPKERFASAIEFGVALRDASSLSIEAVDLPALDPLTRDEVLVSAPQPIAECVSSLEAARTPAALRAALWQATTTVVQYVGNLALAIRQRTDGRHADSPSVSDLLRKLATDGLDATNWWALTRELVNPFADKAQLYPIPELVEIFYQQGATIKNAVDALLLSRSEDPGAQATADAIRNYLVGALTVFARALRTLRFLHDYRLAVSTAGRVEAWMGLRRSVRVNIDIQGGSADGPIIVDRDGVVVIHLGSVASCAEPNPGAPREMFFLVGAIKGAARMLALPGQLEMRRRDVWSQHRIAGISDRGATEKQASVGDDEAPYLGLSTFTPADAGRYFGREAEVIAFINRMAFRRFVAVVGPSGSGKSSFIQAGVLANLHEPRTVAIIRPGITPLQALSRGMSSIEIEVAAEELASNPHVLSRKVLDAGLMPREVAGSESRPPLLLVVDQFEELVTMCHDEQAQAAFAEALLHVAAADVIATSVIITLRDDFPIRVAQIPALRDTLAPNVHLLTTPVEDDLKRILTEPARRVGYEFEDDALVEQIAKEVSHQSAAMALLSFTAYQLWQFRDKHFRQLTRKAYNTLGGVGGALAHHAESVLSTMNEAELMCVREIFRQLVTADGTRATMSRTELLQVAQSEHAAAVLERLIGARLLVAQEDAEQQDRIEVIHEALLAAWPRLVKWRHEDAEGARMRDQLRVAVRQWNERGRNKSLLWRGDALTEYRLWRLRYPGGVTELEQAFADESLAEAARSKRIRQVAAGILATSLVATTLVFAGLRTKAIASEAMAKETLTASYVEQGRKAVLEGDFASALLYLTEAETRRSSDPGLEFLLSRTLDGWRGQVAALKTHGSQVSKSEFSADNSRLMTAADDGVVNIYDARTYELVETRNVREGGGSLRALWGSDSARYFTIDGDGELNQWQVGDKMSARRLSLKSGALSFIKLGKSVIASLYDGAMYIVSEDASREPEAVKNDTYQLLASGASTRGDILIAGGTKTAPFVYHSVLYRGGKIETLSKVHEHAFSSFSPDSKYAATWGIQNYVVVWDTSTWKVKRILGGHIGFVHDVAWSPDGIHVATTGADATIRIWNLTTEDVIVIRGHANEVLHLRYADNGDTLVSGSKDGTVRIWDAKVGFQRGVYFIGGEVYSLGLSTQRDHIAVSSRLGVSRVVSAQAMTAVRIVPPVDNADSFPNAPQLSGTTLARQTTRGFEIRDIVSGKVSPVEGSTSAMPRIAVGSSGTIYSMGADGTLSAHSANGARKFALPTKLVGATAFAVHTGEREFVVATADKQVHWISADGTRIASVLMPYVIRNFLWSRDGKLVIATTTDGQTEQATFLDSTTRTLMRSHPKPYYFIDAGASEHIAIAPPMSARVELWTRSGTLVAEIEATATVTDVKFIDDGEMLLVSSYDGAVFLWSVREKRVVANLRGADSNIARVVVTPDGQYVVGVGGSFCVWSLRSYELLYRVAASGGYKTWLAVTSDGSKAVYADGRGLMLVQDIAVLADVAAKAYALSCELPEDIVQMTSVGRMRAVRCKQRANAQPSN